MAGRISFHTLGCRLNQAETATLEQQFEALGWEVVSFGQATDVVVVNTCTVTARGDADMRQAVRRIGRTNPGADIALVGCQAQTQPDALKGMPGVRWVVGTARKMELPQIVAAPDSPQVSVEPIPAAPFTMPAAAVNRQRTRANLKIQDGCNCACSFCIVPTARGPARSREFDDVRREAVALVEAGHREIVLTGVNLGAYKHGDKRLRDVVVELTGLAGLDRLRVSSVEPTGSPAALLPLMQPNSVLCRHLHIALQSGSDWVLQRMSRRHTAAEFRDLVLTAHSQVEAICLGADVIVGFPGETEARFAETHEFLQSLPLAYLHVFSYSPREGTPSFDYPQETSPATITERNRLLRQLSQAKRTSFLQAFVRSEGVVLFEQRKAGRWTGVTDNFIRVAVDSDLDLTNQLAPVRFETVEGELLRAVLC